MELISWALNTIDTIFSTRKSAPGEAVCPAGTAPVGYLCDTGKWKMLCLSNLSIEDIEDLFIFVILVIGIILIGTGIVLVYRKLLKMDSTYQNAGQARCIQQIEKLEKTMIATTGELSRKVDYIMGSLRSFHDEFKAAQ